MDAFGTEAAFIARMTASTTHELRNALAVVKESAGLVEDLTLALQQRTPVNPDRMLTATRRIDAQVTRAADLLTSLNRLAHGLDHRAERIDLGAHLRHVVFLSQRFARLRRMRLEIEGGDGTERAVHANALHLLMLLTAAIDCCIEQLPEESVVGIRVAGSADRPSVGLTGSADAPVAAAPEGAASWPTLAALAGGLGVSVTTGAAGFGFQLDFSREGAG